MRIARRFAICAVLLAAAAAMAQERAATPANNSLLQAGSSTIEIVCDCPKARPDMEILRGWVRDATEAIETYYGRFPVQRLRIAVNATAGRGVQSGTTYNYGGALIRVSVGRDSDAADLKRDWVMTHEMIHLTQPELDERYAWMQEGLAVYVEPIARVQAGQLSDEKVWGDMVRDMPKGLPAAGDRGLDNTPTWGRTYWGGAMFFLLADVGIREQTGNRYGLQQALRAMLDARGKDSNLRNLFAEGDRSTHTNVLAKLYEQMRDTPVTPDLNDLWRRLGVTAVDGRARFDDDAPLAQMRRAITQ
jgi:hypothetical protein